MPGETSELLDSAARLRFAVTRLARLLRYQDQHDLTATAGAALATIVHHGPVTLGDLAARERVAPPSISRVIAKLEEAGLVARRVDPVDRRISWMEATAAGRRQLEVNRRRRTAWLTRQLEALAPQDRARLEDALDVLERLVEEPGGEAAP